MIIDLFIAAGQSNAEGRGDSTAAPVVTNGSLEYTGSALVALDDPVGGADTGSAWPAFANAYFASTGRAVCISESAEGGTGLMANTGGSDDWSLTGGLYAAAVTKGTNALTALAAAGHTATLRGVLWHQGERDSLGYTSPSTLQADYQAALTALHGRFEASFAQQMGFYVFRLGRPYTADDAGFVKVRAAQDAACTGRIVMAYTNCVNFVTLGWMNSDVSKREYHYSQDGYNDMGTVGGAFVGASITPRMRVARASAAAAVL